MARRLNPPRDVALLAFARAGADLLRGGRNAVVSRAPGAAKGIPPQVDPIPDDMEWSTPPEPERGARRSIYDTGSGPESYDVDLLERLNDEYADRPLVPNPPSYALDARYKTAQARLRNADRQIGLMGSTVLEVGCSEGHLVWYLANDLGCDAYGVDVVERASWLTFEGPRAHFVVADLALENPFPEDKFDRLISYAVWEHVLHPYAMLEQVHRILKPGGLALITANLYAGPKASHRYREIFFPWPHLLFSDETIRDWDQKHGRKPKGSSWVNRLSWAQYQDYFDEIGFITRKVSFRETEIDEDFYRRFEDVLGRFPRRDLRRDFFTVILEKPTV